MSQAAPSAAWRGLPKGSGWAMTHPQPEGAAGVLGLLQLQGQLSGCCTGPSSRWGGQGAAAGAVLVGMASWGVPAPGIDPGGQGRGSRAFIRGDTEMGVATGHPSPRWMGPVGAGTGAVGPLPRSVPLQGSPDPATSCCSQRGGSFPYVTCAESPRSWKLFPGPHPPHPLFAVPELGAGCPPGRASPESPQESPGCEKAAHGVPGTITALPSRQPCVTALTPPESRAVPGSAGLHGWLGGHGEIREDRDTSQVCSQLLSPRTECPSRALLPLSLRNPFPPDQGDSTRLWKQASNRAPR